MHMTRLLPSQFKMFTVKVGLKIYSVKENKLKMIFDFCTIEILGIRLHWWMHGCNMVISRPFWSVDPGQTLGRNPAPDPTRWVNLGPGPTLGKKPVPKTNHIQTRHERKKLNSDP